MFHPGKVLNVHKEKNNTQATVEMWDENLFTLHVSPNLASKLKKEDIVLIDYSPISDKLPIPKQNIIKIFDKKDTIWGTYKNYFKKKKAEANAKKQKVKLVPVSQTPSFAG